MKNNMPIGIFDSGLGGLTVLKSLQKKLPNESFVYIGDTQHVPYGNKSESSIIGYSKTLSQFLINEYEVKMIIVACNTASSVAIKPLNQLYNIPIVDVISPLQSFIVNDKSQEIKRIGVIGTHNTIYSKSYENLFLDIKPSLQVFSQPCPLFVPIIEEGLEDHPIAQLMIKEYLAPLVNNNIEALILGCTHYPILYNSIASYLSSNIQIVNSSEILSKYIKNFLQQSKLSSTSSNNETSLLVTDLSQNFNRFAAKILNNNFRSISKINLF
tara:strand:- start:205 stop:1014 length:810 start_codon:yes stop_codon:yes gene_type:complete